MAFKNALKMLISKFGLMWVLLLYMLITSVLVVSMGVPFAFPVIGVFKEAGVGELLSAFMQSVTRGENVSVWFDELYAIVQSMKSAILSSPLAAFSTGAFVVVVLVFAYRFIFGLYEIPLIDVLEGAMSSNAHIGFTGRFIARLGKSCKFVLVKMLYTVVFDALILSVSYGLFELFNVSFTKIFAPFVIMIVLLVLLAVRYGLIAMWAPAAVLREGGIFRSFGFSVKSAFRHFGSVFSTYLVAWTLIIAVNMLVGLFTFGAGLILTIPMSLLFMHLLNMATYYGKNGKRYYVDATTVVTPPIVTEQDK